MSEVDYEDILALEEEDLDEYVSVCLANFQRVTPRERKKLSGLMKFYAKKPHPFRSCVRDNTKRFGKDRAERVCAVLKDLIKGTTKWRGSERKKKAHMSEQQINEFALELDDTDLQYLLEWSEEEVKADELGEEFGNQDQRQLLAEMYLAEGPSEEADGLIWKTVLREGEWRFSPSVEGPVDIPIIVKKDGKSSYTREAKVISMSEIMENFRDEAVEHVTIPLSHKDSVLENTGYIKDLRIAQDDVGRWVLQAAHEFTEPEVQEKVLRGTIANTSAGVLFDYVKKEVGKRYGAVLAHVALTNKPWLNGMKPFGVNASEEELAVLSLSEEPIDPADDAGGGDNSMAKETDEDTQVDAKEEFLKELGLSEGEIKSIVARNAELEKKDRDRRVEDRIKAWEEEGKAPALLTEAKTIMMADTGSKVLHLSEGDQGFSASEIVERLVGAASGVNLSDDPVKDEDASKDRPKDDAKDENEFANLSDEVRATAGQLYLEGGMSSEDAIAEAKKRHAKAQD